MSDLKRTSLYPCHIQLGARMVPFAGFEMPVQYSGVLEETKAVRKSAGLFDVSHMGQFLVRGPKALSEIQKLVTNDLNRLQLGQAQYNVLCDPKGHAIDDLVVYNRKPNEVFICVNASNIEKDFNWMKSKIGSNAELTNLSDSLSLLALQGPHSEKILSKLAHGKILQSLLYYWGTDLKVSGIETYISRTGYTGEDGFELYVPNESAPKLWNALLEAGKEYGILPIGLGARDTLRLEMGYALYGHELSPEINPLEAGLGWVVKLNKEEFIGQPVLKNEKSNGLKRQLRALLIEDKRIARQGYPVLSTDNEPAGIITSGTFSPHLEIPIALALIDSKFADQEKFQIEIRNAKVPAKRVKLPFVPSHTKGS